MNGILHIFDYYEIYIGMENDIFNGNNLLFCEKLYIIKYNRVYKVQRGTMFGGKATGPSLLGDLYD